VFALKISTVFEITIPALIFTAIDSEVLVTLGAKG
jgi:hypothetical protein